MAEITKETTILNIKNVLKAFMKKVEEAKNYIDFLPLEGREIVDDYDSNKDKTKDLLNESITKENFFEGLTNEELIDYANTCYELNEQFDLRVRNLCKVTKLLYSDKKLLSERLDEIKKLLDSNFVLNNKEDKILYLLNSFDDDELRIVQKDLYDLQEKIYKKLNFTQNKAARQFYNTHRKGLFVTKDETGKIIKLNYTPGNDVVFVNKKGELLKYAKYEEGSRSKFFGNVLGIGKNRADWMMMVAGYDYSNIQGMNIPTTNTKRSTFSEFNIFGNELKSEIAPDHRNDKVKCEVFDKYPEIYARFGDRISGIKGNIIELDNGTGKVLGNVPYFHQCDNETVDGDLTGDDMCQLTSLAMLLTSKGVKSKNQNKQLEDLLYEIAKEEGRGGSNLWTPVSTTYKKIIPKLKEKDSIDCNGLFFDANKGELSNDLKFQTIVSQIYNGNPIIVDLKHGNNFQYGHVVLCIGYTEKSLIIHDPYGNLEHGSNNGYGGANRDYNGAFVEYPKTKYKLGKNWIRFLEEVENEEKNN